MDIGMGLLVPTSTVAGTIMNVVNKGLAVAGLTIAREDARVLAEMRAESLDYHELVEFGTPAIATIAEAVASSPCLSQDSVVQTLADLQGSFYALRDELPAEVPDDEIAEALRGCLDLRFRYDTWFAAHEIPCDIQYQLSKPVDPDLIGIDYIEAWLEQLMSETRWIARFDVESCIAVLERVCPDYRGLHVNLYGLLFPHEGELVPVAAKQSASPD